MEVTIERLGHRGDGVAAGPVFVARALPGEMVSGEVDGGRIFVPKILRPAPERVSPPCPHFRGCGGCALQHASDAFVADWKADVVRQACAARGLEVEIAGVATSPPASRRRAVLAGRRTKRGTLVGFHARASETIVAIPDCRILHPDLMAAVPALEALTTIGASRTSEVSLAVAQSEAGVDVAVSGAKPADGRMRAELAAIARRFRLARLTWDGEVVAMAAPPGRRFGRARVVPPPGAFLQATDAGEAALVGAVRDAVAGAARVVDLFAGAGTFALPLAETSEVHAVEADAGLLAALEAGWRRADGLKNVTTEARDLFRRPLLPDELARFDAAVIDPPRAGAAAQVAALARSGPASIAMASCNPVTFARDAQHLVAAGFSMAPVLVVDQFRWSPHVELAASFRRDHMRRG